MTRSKRFEPIQEIVASAADDLSRTLGEAARRVADLERQLDQLKSYREEYVRSAAAATGAVDAVRMQNYRSFLDRLTEALQQHGVKLERARADHESRRVQWSAKRIEAESLGRAIDRFRRQEMHESDQREQRESDDAALRIATARAGSGQS